MGRIGAAEGGLSDYMEISSQIFLEGMNREKVEEGGRAKEQQTSLSVPDPHVSLDRELSRRLKSAWRCPLRGDLGGQDPQDAKPSQLCSSPVDPPDTHILLLSMPQLLPTSR